MYRTLDGLPLDDPRVKAAARAAGHRARRRGHYRVARKLTLHPMSSGRFMPKPQDRAATLAGLRRAIATVIGGAA